MAVKKVNLMEYSEEERRTIGLAEERIDSELKSRYLPGKPLDIVFAHDMLVSKLTPRVMTELVKKYPDWKIEEISREPWRLVLRFS